MRRIALASTLIVSTVATTGLALAAPTKSNGAQKSGLASPSASMGSCQEATSSAAGKQTANGFAVLNAPGKPGSAAAGRKIVGEVALKGAPAGTYDVMLSTAATSCGTKVATLTVGSSGTGNASISTPGGGGTYHVVLSQQVAPLLPTMAATTVQRYASAPVTLR